MQILSSTLKRDSVYFDVRANVSAIALPMAALVADSCLHA